MTLLSNTTEAGAPASVFAATLAGAAPTLRRPPPEGAVKRHTTSDAEPEAPKPRRMSRRQTMASIPKVVSVRDSLGPVPAAGDDSEEEVAAAETAASAANSAPEVPWADDQAPSGLPSLGDKLMGGEVAIDLPVLMRSRMLITASSGAGKSWAVRRLVEQTAPLVQQLIIDPEGEFETLAERFPFAVYNNRKDQERPLSKYSPSMLAQELVKKGISAVLDLSEFPYEGNSKHMFVKQFIKGLMALDQQYWRHVMVIIDEAHLYAPQQDKSDAKEACIELAGRGRKRGLCPVLATQRLSMLNKSVAAELQNRMIGLTILDRDLKRAADELGMPVRHATSLLTAFEPGNFFVYGPALTRSVQRMKVGPVVTTHGVNLGDLKPPSAPSAELMDDIFANSKAKEPAPSPAAGPSASNGGTTTQHGEDLELLRVRIATYRAELLAPVVHAQDPAAKAAAVKRAAQSAGVTDAAIYQWLAKFDPANPIASMLPARVSKIAIASLDRPAQPTVSAPAVPTARSAPATGAAGKKPGKHAKKTHVAPVRARKAAGKKASPPARRNTRSKPSSTKGVRGRSCTRKAAKKPNASRGTKKSGKMARYG